MSLLGSRGRFSHDNNKLLQSNADFSSALSSIGRNPTSLFNIKIEKHEDNRFKNVNLNKVNNTYDSNFSSHSLYNSKLKKDDDEFYDKYSDKFIEDKKNNKKKTSIWLIVAMVVVEIFTIIGVVALGTVIRYTNMTQNVKFNKAAVQNTNIDEATLAVMKGYKTVAVFGLDSRTGSVGKGNNSDVNLIVNLNLESGDVQLVSLYRDLYLNINDQNVYNKLNAAYSKGGPEGAVKAINKNFDLNITNFFAFNWKAVADGVELLGGVDLEITKAEYKYLNAFIHETCIATGIDAKNPAAHYVKSAGMQHLDGVQSVAYGRLRLMDSDFQRVERQKKIIALCLEKAKKLDIPSLRLILEVVLPQIAYEFDMNEMLSIMKIIQKINITESCGCPETNNVVTMNMGACGDCIVPLNLDKAVVKLHKILYNDDDYETSKAVKQYSNRITELRKKYADENLINASIKESSIQESLLDLIKPNTRVASKSNAGKKTNVSSKSNASKDVKTNPDIDIDKNVIVVPDIGNDYPAEPEEDDSKNVVVNTDISQLPIAETTTININNSYSGPVSAPGSSVVETTSNNGTVIGAVPSSSQGSVVSGNSSPVSVTDNGPSSVTNPNSSVPIVVNGPPQ